VKLPLAQLLTFLGMVLLIATGMATWLSWRLVWILDLPAPWSLVGTAAIVGWIGLMVAGMILPRLLGKGPVMDRFAQLAFLALGLFSLVLSTTMVRDLLWLSWDLFSGIPALAAVASVPRLDRALAGSTVAIGGISLGLLLLGWRQARSTPAVRRVEIPIAGLPAALDGFTIAQLSDIHVGPTIDATWLAPVVARTNELQADLVVITGDVVDGSVRDLARHVAPLGGLRGRHGTFFVTGNHEYYAGARDWCAHMQGLGLRVLDNEHVLIEHGTGRLLLVGVPDHHAGRFPGHRAPDPAAALAGAPSRDTTVLLAHQPRTGRLAQGLGIDLQLSGHTHGGQIWPWMHMVWLQQPMTAGLERLGDLQVYTSRGTGYWGPPVRLGAPPEISLLVLRAA